MTMMSGAFHIYIKVIVMFKIKLKEEKGKWIVERSNPKLSSSFMGEIENIINDGIVRSPTISKDTKLENMKLESTQEGYCLCNAYLPDSYPNSHRLTEIKITFLGNNEFSLKKNKLLYYQPGLLPEFDANKKTMMKATDLISHLVKTESHATKNRKRENKMTTQNKASKKSGGSTSRRKDIRFIHYSNSNLKKKTNEFYSTNNTLTSKPKKNKLLSNQEIRLPISFSEQLNSTTSNLPPIQNYNHDVTPPQRLFATYSSSPAFAKNFQHSETRVRGYTPNPNTTAHLPPIKTIKKSTHKTNRRSPLFFTHTQPLEPPFQQPSSQQPSPKICLQDTSPFILTPDNTPNTVGDMRYLQTCYNNSTENLEKTWHASDQILLELTDEKNSRFCFSSEHYLIKEKYYRRLTSTITQLGEREEIPTNINSSKNIFSTINTLLLNKNCFDQDALIKDKKRNIIYMRWDALAICDCMSVDQYLKAIGINTHFNVLTR